MTRDNSYLFKFPADDPFTIDTLRRMRKCTKDGVKMRVRAKAKGYDQDAPHDKADYFTVYVQDMQGHNCLPVIKQSPEQKARESLGIIIDDTHHMVEWAGESIKRVVDEDGLIDTTYIRTKCATIDRFQHRITVLKAALDVL